MLGWRTAETARPLRPPTSVARRRATTSARRRGHRRGSLHLVDFAHGRSQDDRVLALMKRAGFRDPRMIGEEARLFGHMRIRYYRATALTEARGTDGGLR
jgi:hypothetical protein